MKHTIFYRISSAVAAVVCLTACYSYLEPLPDGSYNSENYKDYPKIIRGYIDKGYSLLPYTYYTTDYIGLDAISDDACYRDASNATHLIGIGQARPSSYPLATAWNRNYQGIYYANLFLEEDLGVNTRYLIDGKLDETLRKQLKGDAFALRAWYEYNLLRLFAGKDDNGNLLGFPISLTPAKMEDIASRKFVRASYDECVNQIIKDCDSAIFYLPLANRDFLNPSGSSSSIEGAIRYKSFDQVSMTELKAMTYLLWASPAFNPANDRSRWEKAATCAYSVIRHKLDKESASVVPGGFDPVARFQWFNTDAPEIIWCSRSSTGTTIEKNFYPQGFNGNSTIVPSQELVDAFPMANGYPISHPLSGYNPQNPYEGRDPRLYATVFYNGATVVRTDNNRITYIFDTTTKGKDSAGKMMTSPTNYYIKKYIYPSWDGSDDNPQEGTRGLFYMRWTHACLIFAEAANEAWGPTDSHLGLSAVDAIAYLRKRYTNENIPGIGSYKASDSGVEDPYLAECSTDPDSFRSLVRNEWRVETCFEGMRFTHLRRWNLPLSEINTDIHRVTITRGSDGGNVYDYSTVVETRSYPSLWLPIPRSEVLNSGGSIVQNEGWNNWK